MSPLKTLRVSRSSSDLRSGDGGSSGKDEGVSLKPNNTGTSDQGPGSSYDIPTPLLTSGVCGRRVGSGRVAPPRVPDLSSHSTDTAPRLRRRRMRTLKLVQHIGRTRSARGGRFTRISARGGVSETPNAIFRRFDDSCRIIYWVENRASDTEHRSTCVNEEKRLVRTGRRESYYTTSR